jgi:hypothetical protein
LRRGLALTTTRSSQLLTQNEMDSNVGLLSEYARKPPDPPCVH